jgi:hypothetical protein
MMKKLKRRQTIAPAELEAEESARTGMNRGSAWQWKEPAALPSLY